MSVDDSGSIDERRLARLLAFEEGLAGGNSDEPPPGKSLLALRDCVRLLEEILPAKSGGNREDPVDPVPTPERIGRFTILGELGRGGFGVVLRAFDPSLKRQVALKVPRPEFLASPDATRRFLREGWAASRLDHPNIVPVLEAGETGPIGYIASALCEGPSLASWLAARSSPVPPRLAARLVAALADAIEHAHGRDVLHRDLKPANILLQGGEVAPPPVASGDALPFIPRLCDFGLAKLLDQATDQTRTAAVLGSPPYMAPEQADGRPDRIGAAGDIYGLGAILYELLTGRPPFRGETSLETIRMVVQDEPPPPRSLRPGLARDLETIALKCLEKRPEHRYPSASALAGDLNRFLDGRPIEARPAGPLRRSGKWARRRPAQAALAASLGLFGLIAAAALIGGQWWQARQNGRLREVNAQLERTLNRAEQSERDARRRLFNSLIRQVQTALDGGHEELAFNLLQSARRQDDGTGTSGFAWSHLDRRLQGRLRILEGNGRLVQSLEVSPDGRALASTTTEETITLWDLAAGRMGSVIPSSHKWIRSIAFAPDSRKLAVSHYQDPPRVSIWDIESGRVARTSLTILNYYPNVMGFSNDGTILFGLHDAPAPQRFRLIYKKLPTSPDLPPVRLDPREGATRLGFDRDEPMLRLIAEALDGKPVAPPSATPRSLRGVAFTEDREIVVIGRGGLAIEIRDRTFQLLAAGIPFGPTARMFVVSENRPVDQMPLPGWESRVDRIRRLFPNDRKALEPLRLGGRGVPHSFSPSGDRLASQGMNSEPYLLDLKSGARETVDMAGHLTSLTFSPDGRSLVMGGFDGRIRIKNLEPAAESLSFQAHEAGRTYKAEAWGLAWSPDGRCLATSGDDGTGKLWDLTPDGPPRERAVLKGHPSMVTSVAWSPDGKALATSGYRPYVLRLWDAKTGDCRGVLSGHEGIVRMVAWSPDGKTLASCGDDRTVRLWDFGGDNVSLQPALSGHRGFVSALAFAPDGRSVASADLDGRVILWDVARRCETRSWNFRTQVYAIAYSPDGRSLAVAATDGSIRIWDPSSPSIDGALVLRGHARWALALAFSPDGKSLASGGIDRTVRIWDPATGQELLALSGHTDRVNRVAFSPDGSTLASCDHSGVVKLWRAGPR